MITPEAQIQVRFVLRSEVSEIRGRNAPNDPKLEQLTVKNTLYTLHTYPLGPNFGPFHSTTIRFRDKRLSTRSPGAWRSAWPDGRQYINWITLRSRYIFHSKTCRFRGTRFLKIGNTPNDPQNYLKHLTSQVSCIHWIFIPEAQISIRFALQPAIFKVQDCQKLEMHPMTPELP